MKCAPFLCKPGFSGASSSHGYNACKSVRHSNFAQPDANLNYIDFMCLFRELIDEGSSHART